MKLFCLVNDDYKVSIDHYLLPSLQYDFEINIEHTNEKNRHTIKREKVNNIINKIRENLEQNILFLDADTQAFGKIQPTIEEYLRHVDLCVLKADNQTVNTGLLGIKCSKKTLKFFEGAYNTYISEDLYDENKAVNYGLKKYPNFITALFLGDKFWCGHRLWIKKALVPKHPIIFHHATIGIPNGVIDKMKQLKLFKEEINERQRPNSEFKML